MKDGTEAPKVEAPNTQTSAIEDLFAYLGEPPAKPKEEDGEQSATAETEQEEAAEVEATGTAEAVEEAEEEGEKTPAVAAAPQEVLDLLADLGSPDPAKAAPKFVQFMQGFAQHILEQLPGIVSNNVGQQLTAAELRREFDKAHPELKGKDDLLRTVAARVQGENPSLGQKQLLAKVAEEAKKQLNIVKTTPSLPVDSGTGGDLGVVPKQSVDQRQQSAMSALLKSQS